jgi:hypothetical protein
MWTRIITGRSQVITQMKEYKIYNLYHRGSQCVIKEDILIFETDI